jgi:ketosteroid isomerase-like protein
MRLRPCLARALLPLYLVACGGATMPPRPAFASADRDGVIAVLRSQQDAWNRGDLDAFMAGYARTPELLFTSGGNVRRGWDETYRKYRERYGAAPETMGKLAFEVLEVQPVGHDGAVLLGRWRLTDTPNAGGGVFSIVLEKRSEGWRIIHDHTSSDSAG